MGTATEATKNTVPEKELRLKTAKLRSDVKNGKMGREPCLDSGSTFCLEKLNGFGDDFRQAEMVKWFPASSDNRQRFGPP